MAHHKDDSNDSQQLNQELATANLKVQIFVACIHSLSILGMILSSLLCFSPANLMQTTVQACAQKVLPSPPKFSIFTADLVQEAQRDRLSHTVAYVIL